MVPLRLLSDIVRRLEPRRSGVVIVKLPVRDGSVGRHFPSDVDDSAGAQVRPSHLLFAGPIALHRLAHRLGESRRFECRVAGVLAAIPRSRVRHDYSHLILGNLKLDGKLASDPEGTLRPGPDGELAVAPFGDRSPRLQWHMRNVGDVVRGEPRGS